MILSTVILAMTTSEELFDMTLCCINSLVDSEPDISIEIIVVESNKNYYSSEFQYPDFVKVIIPDSKFNFHKFLNIGIIEATGDFVALCNNDLIFEHNWFTEILNVAKEEPKIMSFSPGTIKKGIDNCVEFEIGYKVRTHIMGWCIVVRRKLFDRIGLLDETFDFYYADNDYAMCLKSNNISHAVVYNSNVLHLEKKSSEKFKVKKIKIDYLKNYNIPEYVLNGDYAWLLENEKSISGFLKYHNKWGDPNTLYRKNRVSDLLKDYGFGGLVKYVLFPKRKN